MKYLIAGWFLAAFLLVPFDGISKHVDHAGFYSILRIDAADDSGYYAILPSLWFDGDVDLGNEPRFYYKDQKTATGYAFNHWGVGSSILWAPWWLLGHSLAWFIHKIQPGLPANGWTFPYMVCTGVAAAFYSLMGILLCRRIYLRYVSDRAATLAAGLMLFSSPLLYYAFIRSRYSHSGEFFLVALLYWRWSCYSES